MAKITTYECTQCGSEIIVREAAETDLTPIYCCGIAVAQVTAARGKKAGNAKPKTAKKTVSRKTATRKAAASRKKSGKK